MKKACFALIVIFLFNSCDKLAIDRDDVVRFDYQVSANEDSFELSNEIVNPYDTEELKRYKDERDKIKEFEIYRIEFRMFSFRADNDSTRINGTANLTSNAGTTFEMELFEVGNEYKDSENHEVHRLTADGVEGAEAYDKLAQELVEADQFTINTGNLSGIVDSLDCEASVYIHYRIKAQ